LRTGSAIPAARLCSDSKSSGCYLARFAPDAFAGRSGAAVTPSRAAVASIISRAALARVGRSGPENIHQPTTGFGRRDRPGREAPDDALSGPARTPSLSRRASSVFAAWRTSKIWPTVPRTIFQSSSEIGKALSACKLGSGLGIVPSSQSTLTSRALDIISNSSANRRRLPDSSSYVVGRLRPKILAKAARLIFFDRLNETIRRAISF